MGYFETNGRTGISDTSLCECGQADQTPDHVLQSCPIYTERCLLIWPQGADLATKLWGLAEDLYRTAGFVASTGLKIRPAQLSIAEEEEEEETNGSGVNPSIRGSVQKLAHNRQEWRTSAAALLSSSSSAFHSYLWGSPFWVRLLRM